MTYKNIHTGEIYETFHEDTILTSTSKKGKVTKKRVIGDLRMRYVSGGQTNKTSNDFKVAEDFNKFNTFIPIQ